MARNFIVIIPLLQEFILKNPQSKKSESSSLADASSKKSLDDFRQVIFLWRLDEAWGGIVILCFLVGLYIVYVWWLQMVEYCEGSDCRRKKILHCFGEQVGCGFYILFILRKPLLPPKKKILYKYLVVILLLLNELPISFWSYFFYSNCRPLHLSVEKPVTPANSQV